MATAAISKHYFHLISSKKTTLVANSGIQHQPYYLIKLEMNIINKNKNNILKTSRCTGNRIKLWIIID